MNGKHVAAIGISGALLFGGIGFAVYQMDSDTNPAANSSAKPSPSGTSIPEEEIDEIPSGVLIGDGLPMMESPDKVKAPSKEAVATFGEAAAREGTAWAEGFAQQTAFYPNVWQKLLAPGAKSTDITPEDYALLGIFMTENGKQKLFNQTATKDLIYSKEYGPGWLVITPKIGDDIKWSDIPMKPGEDTFNIVSTKVGPKSSYNGKPTLRVEFYDIHTLAFEQSGKPQEARIGRHNIYYLAQTNDPNQPWLLDNWSIEPAKVLPKK